MPENGIKRKLRLDSRLRGSDTKTPRSLLRGNSFVGCIKRRYNLGIIIILLILILEGLIIAKGEGKEKLYAIWPAALYVVGAVVVVTIWYSPETCQSSSTLACPA